MIKFSFSFIVSVLVLLLLNFLHYNTYSQVTGEVNVMDRDMFYAQYSPQQQISDSMYYSRISAKWALPPIKLKHLLIANTFGIDKHHFKYDKENSFEVEPPSNVYNINHTIFINHSLSERWSLNIQFMTYLISSFEKGSDLDWRFNSNIYLEKTIYRAKGGYYLLGFGVGYLTLNGRTQVNPIVQLKSRLNEKWSFALGLPNTYIKCDIQKRHSLKLLGELNDFYTFLEPEMYFVDKSKERKVVFTTVSVGLEYNYWVAPVLGLMFKASFPVYDSFEIRDKKDNTKYEFKTSYDQPLFNIGIKFNPIRELQNSLKPL